MGKDLERDLGLYSTVAISIGAMIGSGIFVLPGLATKLAGPAVILAYLLAGLVVLPAALSKAEMATAMPEAGGTYLYIDRAMGPLPGTIAGVGAWFSLVFKSAFAFVGLGAYLLLFVPLGDRVVFVGLALALLLLVVNVVGVKQSGRLQLAIVLVVLASLFVFIADGLTFVDQPQYHPFSPYGAGGLVAATGFVFVSYAGVTKIASVAEEVEDPGRNIPLAIIGSILTMMFVYTFVVFVVVGVSPADELGETLTPMALAAGTFLGRAGVVGVGVVAVLALTSMANAGILSSSRFPLAMSRDSLAPEVLGRVNDRFSTPVYSIGFTGAILLALIAFVPVRDLAKLASAFQILVFAFVNAALVAFRESELDSYDPEFVAPGYPWVQLFGIVGGLVLLAGIGALPLAGAVGIIVAGAAWYRLYGRERTEREGAALDVLRRSSVERALDRTRQACADRGETRVLVPVGRPVDAERRGEFLDLLRLAADVASEDGLVQVVRFEEVPEQLALGTAAEANSAGGTDPAGETDPAGMEFEDDSGALPADLEARVEFGEIVTHDTKRAIANFADHYDVDVVLGEWHPSRWRAELLGADVDWYMRHGGTDVVFARNRGYDDLEEIVVVADEGPFDPLEIVVADALAVANGAPVHLVETLTEPTTDERVGTAEAYLDSLAGFCRAPTESTVVATDDRVGALVDVSSPSSLLVVGTSAHHIVYDVLFGSVPDRLVERVDSTVLLTHSWRPRGHTFLRSVLVRLLY